MLLRRYQFLGAALHLSVQLFRLFPVLRAKGQVSLEDQHRRVFRGNCLGPGDQVMDLLTPFSRKAIVRPGRASQADQGFDVSWIG